MTIAFYPGCSHHGLSQEFDHTARLLCAHLKIDVQDVDDWNCCGATAAHSLDHDLSLALNVRNLAKVRGKGLGCVATPCAGCFSRLKTTAHEIQRHPERLRRIAANISCDLPEGVEVKHLLQVILETCPPAAIPALVKKPLTGLKLAAYYGCLLTRPASVTQFDDPEQPTAMDGLMRALGAETVVWSYKAECCGGGFNAAEPAIALDLGAQILSSAHNAGAQAIVVACPLCQLNLDSHQGEMGAVNGEKYSMPVIYFTQLIGFALGYSWQEMQFRKLLTSPQELFNKLHLL